MEVKKISTETNDTVVAWHRPEDFDAFVGQEQIKEVLRTAISSAHKRDSQLGHILFSGPSGYGKTTLAHIVAKRMGKNFKAITGYAISKPAEIISILNTLETGDILFIDEIHRLKPNIEEVLYIAMEDFVIDVVMPEWDNMRIPIQPFTLIGATTKPENLSQPLKNRFVYHFHFMDYNVGEKRQTVEKYLLHHDIKVDADIINDVCAKVDSVPREIYNYCIKIRDFVIAKEHGMLDAHAWGHFLEHSKIDDGGMTPLHQKYLAILEQYDRPIGIKTIAAQLGVNEQAIEEDIEPLLMKLGKVEKTAGGRILSI